jgi:pyruvate/2-oxoglutarate dehydrogenase complex dihydrolipoamide acyltransferase (E2) component
LVQAIAASCKAEPSLNAWYYSEAGSRRLVTRVDVGLSIDLEGGLIVPVLRNVGEPDSADLPARLERMRADAAARSIPAEELRGATITLSNFGMIGGRFASLIVVPPQVAILPLSLTFDHRAVTGGEAARFLAQESSCTALKLQSPGGDVMTHHPTESAIARQTDSICRRSELIDAPTATATGWSPIARE